jgi:hypothetical protein
MPCRSTKNDEVRYAMAVAMPKSPLLFRPQRATISESRELMVWFWRSLTLKLPVRGPPNLPVKRSRANVSKVRIADMRSRLIILGGLPKAVIGSQSIISTRPRHPRRWRFTRAINAAI